MTLSDAVKKAKPKQQRIYLREKPYIEIDPWTDAYCKLVVRGEPANGGWNPTAKNIADDDWEITE